MPLKFGVHRPRPAASAGSGSGARARGRTRARLGTLALLFGASTACATFPEFDGPDGWPTPRRGAVVSEHPLATAVGLEILDAGGNAADAAVATALALAVVYPQAGNLGGGGFALFVPHDPADDEEQLRALDFRETAPGALVPELFLVDGEVDRDRALLSRLSVGVPGTPAGLFAFHEQLGRLSFERVAAPAIALARDGHHLDAWRARALRKERDKLARSPGARRVFFDGVDPHRAGALIVQPDLARTLERYARSGPSGFYQGETADLLIAEMGRGGLGVLAAEDLLGYEPVWRTPLRGWFSGMEVISMPPPSSGGLVLLQVLAILEGLPLAVERKPTARGFEPTPRALHWWAEAMRIAFAERAAHLGDPDFVDPHTAELLSVDWVHAKRVSIGERANLQISPTVFASRAEGDQTTHISVLDDRGNAVSMTTTLNSSFGCGLLVEGAGFVLNNEMDDFSIQTGSPNDYGLVGSGANQLAPGKRPLSSMTPAVVRDGGNTVALVLGSPGGPRIITSVLQVMLRILAYDHNLVQAIRAPRVHQQWQPAATRFERGWPEAVVDDLVRRGHELDPRTEVMGSVQGIRVRQPGATPTAVSDPRRGGAGGVQGGSVADPAPPPLDD